MDDVKATDAATGRDVPAERIAQPVRVREAEALPNYGVEQADVDYKVLLEKYKDRSLFVDGVRKDALTKTKPHNWLARKDKTGNVTLNLMGPGAERIKTNCPIGFLNKRQREEKWSTDEGQGYTVYFEADVYLGDPRTGTLPIIGSCRSDDDFFSTEHAELVFNEENPEHKAMLESGEGKLSYDKKTLYVRRRIPANEVHKDNIIKSALTNLVVNGVTRVLGIRSIAPEELREAGIDVEKIPSIEYGSNKAKAGVTSPAAEQKREEIWKWLLEMNGGDVAKAKKALVERTAFNDYKGQDDHTKLTEKQIDRKHGEIKSEYDRWRDGGAQPKPGGKPQPPPAKGGNVPSPEEAARIKQRELDDAKKHQGGQQELV